MKILIILILIAGIAVASFPADCIAQEYEETVDIVKPENDDYVPDQVYTICESESEAETIAEAYSAATGYDFSLIGYNYGVATFSIGESVSDMSSETFDIILDNTDKVTAALSIGADEEYDLEELYPDYYMELMAIEKPDTSRENFDDPFIRSDNSKYQWYHEMLGDKYVWDEMDRLTNDIDYDGALPADFMDNLSNEVVVIIDSGINETQEDFYGHDGSYAIISPMDVTGVATGYDDLVGHGSNVAGIIGNAADNDKGGRGIASGVKIMPINVCPNSSGSGIKTSSTIEAINIAIDKKQAYLNGNPQGLNICVINMSLGGTAYSGPLNVAVQNAIDLGITVVAAATNSNESTYGYPASYDNVISVASVNSYYVKSEFSNYGDKVSIAAPGGERSTYIEEIGVQSPGELVYASGRNGSDSYIGYYGTSQASPMVAACAALLYAYNPDITPAQIKDRIQETATPVYPGYQIGAGCLNVAAALNISEDVAVPFADKMGGSIPAADFDVNLGLLGISELSAYEGNIYFTVDGSDPDLREETVLWNGTEITEGRVTYELNLSNPLPISFKYEEGEKYETLKVMGTLYGRKSEIVSYQYNYYSKEEIPILYCNGAELENDSLVDLAIGKKLKFELIDRLTGENIKAYWESSDMLAVSVDESGILTGMNYCNEPVNITATPLSEQYQPISINVNVKTSVKRVEIAAENENIILYSGDTINLSWKNYPESASQAVIFTSDNPNVAKVDDNGLVEAVSSGTAEIKLTAADGSGAYDIVSVQCERKIGADELVIRDTENKGFVAAGKNITLKISYLNGEPLNKNCNVTWDFSDESKAAGIEYYASVNHKTGVVSVRSNDYVYSVKSAEVIADCEYFSEPKSFRFDIYPRLSSMTVNKDSFIYYVNESGKSIAKGCFSRESNSFYFKTGLNVDLNRLINREPYNCANSFSFSTTDENVAYVIPDTDELALRKPGKATITMKANDGSALSVKFNVVVLDTVSITNKTGFDNISPGKSLSFLLNTDAGISPSTGLVEWSVSGVKMTSGFRMEELVTLGKYTGKMTMPAGDFTEVRDFLNRNKGKGYDYLIVTAKFYPSKGLDFSYTATRYVQVLPVLTSKIKIRNGSGDVISQLDFSNIGEKASIYPYSLPDSSLDSGYSFSSSNPSVAKVNELGEVTSVSRGTTYINIKAGDLSGKTAKIKVVVNYPYVKSITLSKNRVFLRTPLPSGVTDPAGSIYLDFDDFFITQMLPEGIRTKVSVSSTNEKVAVVTLKEGCDPNSPVYTIKPVNKGTAKIKVMALDGSKKCAYVNVTVVRPNVNISLDLKGGTRSLRTQKSAYLKVLGDSGVSNSKVKYFLKGIGGTEEEREASLNEMMKYVSLNSGTGLIKVKNAKTIGTEERTICVYAKALDEWQAETEPLIIKIAPGIVYINDLRIRPNNDNYSLASGSKVQMTATCNSDATDKKITWHIYDEDPENPGNPQSAEGSEYATVSSKGIVKANSKLTERHAVFVKAAAASGPMTESYAVKINLYPRAKLILVSSYPVPGISTVSKGDYLMLRAESISEGAQDALNQYDVTYSTGHAKVYLEATDDGRYDGSCVKVYGLSKGQTKIVFTMRDGSGKKVVYYVKTM